VRFAPQSVRRLQPDGLRAFATSLVPKLSRPSISIFMSVTRTYSALLICVVVGLLNSECSQQSRANENKHGAYRQHIERQGKVIRLDDPKHSNLTGRRRLCGGLSKFDRQLFFKTALIALECAPIAALPHWLDAPHHHSGSAILAPGAPFDDLQRTRNKLGLGHGLLLFQAGALPDSQPPTPGIGPSR
jgi:hypothetical protein